MNLAHRERILFYTASALLIGGLHFAQAFTTNLVPIADTYMRDLSPTTNFGGISPLLVGVAKEPFFIQNRALLKFDFAGIPTNATITGVTLTIVITRSNTDPAEFDLNRMLVNWDENEVTWYDRIASSPWLEAGAQRGTDFVAAASVTAEIDGSIFSSAGMISDVQLWLRNPATNYGWILLATGDKVGSGKQIGSRESEFTPVLTVDYTLSPPAPANPPVLFAPAAAANGFRFSFHAESNRIYTVEFRDSLGVTNWGLLTNIPAQPAARTVTLTNAMSSPQRYYRVRTP